MKTRAGYVSNSSSSSFLVLYHDVSEFDNFSKFDGYETMLKDIKSNSMNIEKCKMHLEMEMNNKIYDLINIAWNRMNENNWPYSATYFADAAFDDLIYFLNLDQDEKAGAFLMDEFHSKLMEYADEHPVPENIDYKEQQKYRYKLKKFAEQHMPDVKETASLLCDKMAEKGYQLSTIRYSDDCGCGSYMEHEFMPFVKICPEAKFHVNILNQH